MLSQTLSSFLSVAGCLVSVGALAAERSLLTKTNSPGFTPPAYRTFNRCDVFENRIELVRGVGELELKETRQVTWNAAAARKLIRAAAMGQIVQSTGPTDIPSTRWEAHLPGFGADGMVLLGTFGTFNSLNQSQPAIQLKNFLDEVCATGTFRPEPSSPFPGE